MKKRIIVSIQICLATVLAVVATAMAASVVGTEADPLVSKSYVDDKIGKVLELVNNMGGTGSTAAVDKDAIVQEVLEQIGDVSGGSISADGLGYVPVSAAVGQTVVGGEGTEIILRAGKGKVAIDGGVAGLVDITTGKELNNGAAVTMNHMMIVPRADGRGVKVTEAAWFLIKGEYQIVG